MNFQFPGLNLSGRGILFTDQFNVTKDFTKKGWVFINSNNHFDLDISAEHPISQYFDIFHIPTQASHWLGLAYDFNQGLFSRNLGFEMDGLQESLGESLWRPRGKKS